jgi:hypothetical protein
VVDAFTRECLGLDVGPDADTSLSSRRVRQRTEGDIDLRCVSAHMYFQIVRRHIPAVRELE